VVDASIPSINLDSIELGLRNKNPWHPAHPSGLFVSIAHRLARLHGFDDLGGCRESKLVALEMARTLIPPVVAICVAMEPTEEEAPFTTRILPVDGAGLWVVGYGRPRAWVVTPGMHGSSSLTESPKTVASLVKGSTTPSVNGMCSGRITALSAWTTVYSAKAPSAGLPALTLRNDRKQRQQPDRLIRLLKTTIAPHPTIRSPFLNRSTPDRISDIAGNVTAFDGRQLLDEDADVLLLPVDGVDGDSGVLDDDLASADGGHWGGAEFKGEAGLLELCGLGGRSGHVKDERFGLRAVFGDIV
jgi:hypothetical protein